MDFMKILSFIIFFYRLITIFLLVFSLMLTLFDLISIRKGFKTFIKMEEDT